MKNLHFLTTTNAVFGRFFTLIAPICNRKLVHNDGYRGIQTLSQGGNLVTILCEKKGVKYIKKVLMAYPKTLEYEQMRHEISILKILNGVRKTTRTGRLIRVLKLTESFQGENYIYLIREYFDGTILQKFSINTQIDVLKECILFFKEISSSVDPRYLAMIPKRSNFSLFATFPIYLIIACLKDLSRTAIFFHTFIIFIRLLPAVPWFVTDYTLNHKDLHPGNILVNGTSVGIIDTEITIFAESGTDLAVALPSYCSGLKQEDALYLINKLLEGDGYKKIITLSIFYTVQSIAMNSVNKLVDSKRELNYLNFLVRNIDSILLKS